jgi:hypothetical protein
VDTESEQLRPPRVHQSLRMVLALSRAATSAGPRLCYRLGAIKSPVDAVRATIAAEHRGNTNGTA